MAIEPTKIRDGLYLSDGQSARAYGDRYDRVITLSRDGFHRDVGSHEYTTDHLPLRDGENHQSDFDSSTDAVVDAIESEDDVLVHCSAGMSRSPAVVATALSLVEEEMFDVIVGELKDKHSSVHIEAELRTHAMKYLENRDQFS